MRPAVVFRFSQTEGPGYLGHYLTREGILWTQINVDAGDKVPDDINGFSGLVLMGGPMSVNDNLPWIPGILNLIRQAVDRDIPVLGHCLGGQLMSKALGGEVGPNPVKEIGWGGVSKVGLNPAPQWLGVLPSSFEVFQWHGETFSIPAGAARVLESAFCPNQAFLLNDRHLGLQCHIEMTAPMYHDMPDLTAPETWGELAANVRFLTHLEGMGVVTPLQLRIDERGLGDPDYIALADTTERRRRVNFYFMKLERLENSQNRKISDGELGIYNELSEKPMRLWYIAGCHMAQTIEKARGRDSFRELVREGCDAFFDAYHK